jgi:hypothetical protein
MFFPKQGNSLISQVIIIVFLVQSQLGLILEPHNIAFDIREVTLVAHIRTGLF